MKFVHAVATLVASSTMMISSSAFVPNTAFNPMRAGRDKIMVGKATKASDDLFGTSLFIINQAEK